LNSDIDSKIIKKLEEQKKREGCLAPWLEFYYQLLVIQSATRAEGGTPAITFNKEAAGNRLGKGLPILQFADLAINWQTAQKAWQETVCLFKNHAEIVGEIPENLNGAGITADLLRKLAAGWFDGTEFPASIVKRHTDRTIVDALIHATLRPFLISHREAVISLVDQQEWRRGYCPVCRGSPDFAFLEKEAGARWLLCYRCDAEWLFQRLECPCCGNLDHKALAYFTDEKELYRLYVCEKCRHYLKAIDLRKREDEALLPLERFLTMELDTQASQEGYLPAACIQHRETAGAKSGA
jgi:FdhE protein